MKFGPYFPVFGLDTETYEVNSYRRKVDIKFFFDHFFFFFGEKKKKKKEKRRARMESVKFHSINLIQNLIILK